MNTNRRTFLQLTGGIAAAGAFTFAPHIARAAGHKVVVVGGGPAGATAARYLLRYDPSLQVTLIEPNKDYHTCFMSNEVIGGMRKLESLRVTYDNIRKLGVNVVHDFVTTVDPAAKIVKTQGGQSFGYDRCVLAPGIDFDWAAVEGYTEASIDKMPHAWKAGPQTTLLRKQLEAMPNGGTVVMSVPANFYRCPPGPYERASLIANYLKQAKPKSKLIVLDAKDAFSKQPLFTQAWERFYGYGTPNSIIEWVPGAKGGKVGKASPAQMTVETEFDKVKGAVVNLIPPQKAGKLAFDTGLVDGKWCPVNKKTFESLKAPGIHIVGDAVDSAPMPKSGYVSNSQAKVAAQAIVALLKGQEPAAPTLINTCYSVASEEYAFSIAGVYRVNTEKNVFFEPEGSGGISPVNGPMEDRKREFHYAHSWYQNMVHDSWG